MGKIDVWALILSPQNCRVIKYLYYLRNDLLKHVLRNEYFLSPPHKDAKFLR